MLCMCHIITFISIIQCSCAYGNSLCTVLLGYILRYTPIELYPTAPLYNIITVYYTILRQKRHFKHER